jgi:uncharacterized protein (DUF1330 family)
MIRGGGEPMTALIITRGTVGDYEHWKSVFDGARSLRDKHGCSSERVLRDPRDEAVIAVVLEFPDAEHATAYTRDPEMQEALERGAIQDPRFELYIES